MSLIQGKLNELKQILMVTRVNGPQTTTIKDVIVTYQTEEIDLPKCEVGDEDL